MCGIVGLISRPGNLREDVLSEMATALAHRGPDGDGFWSDTKAGIGLGHRRLAVIDLSSAAGQPMISQSKRYVIAFNGEIYNFAELKTRLRANGFNFKTTSDTEALLEHIEYFGLEKTLQLTSGMFAFALYDTVNNSLIIARDYHGKKPLYYGWSGNDFIFGSELKALRAHPEFNPAIHPDVLALYLKYACVPAPYCIHGDFHQLPAGSYIHIALDKFGPKELPEPQSFWSPKSIIETKHSDRKQDYDDEGVISEFTGLLEKCVQERMISDVPIGAFLSGGIDSSLISAVMQSQSNKPIKTFSIGFDESAFNEAHYARDVANHLGTDHQEFYVSAEDALNVIPKLPQIYDEPFADISQIPTYLVSKMAREHTTVALTGDGGDELLGGYRRHISAPSIWKYASFLPYPLRRLTGSSLSAILNLLPPKPFTANATIGSHILKQPSQIQVHDNIMQYWDNSTELVIEAEPDLPPLTWLEAHHLPRDLSFLEEMTYRDSISYLSNDVLVKVDRATMAVSLEARAPLLDRRLYEYAWSLPDHFKVRNGTGKWLLRKALERYVPRDLFERPKAGFNTPISIWLKGPLKPWADDLLSETHLIDNGFRPERIRKAWQEHLQGKKDHGQKLWIILQYQAWKKEFS